MDTFYKRALLFLIGCIGTRSMLVYIAKTYPSPVLGWLALLPAAGFLYFFISGTRQTGPEVFGDRIWWNALRPVHAILYISFAVAAILGVEYAWVFLLVDVVLGLASFLIHHGAERLGA